MIRGVIGMLHLPPLPGDPRHAGEQPEAIGARLLADAGALVDGGVDALLLENFGSMPLWRGDRRDPLPPHQVALMTRFAGAVRERFDRPLGINCLRNDAAAALAIARAVGGSFVRVNVHVGAYVTDQGLIEGEAAATLRYRRAIGAEAVLILADVLVKHAAPLSPLAPEAATRDTLERGLADGVIVTGAATGSAVDAAVVATVRRAAGERPVYLGSGVTPQNAAALAPHADGAIVGTWVKEGGIVEAPVSRERTRALVAALRPHLRRTGSP
jgi:hypothetical protein